MGPSFPPVKVVALVRPPKEMAKKLSHSSDDAGVCLTFHFDLYYYDGGTRLAGDGGVFSRQ